MTNEDLETKAAEYLEVGGMGHMMAGQFVRDPSEDTAEANSIWNAVAVDDHTASEFARAIERQRFGSN